MISLLLVLSPVRDVFTARVCMPFLHPWGYCAMEFVVVQRMEEHTSSLPSTKCSAPKTYN